MIKNIIQQAPNTRNLIENVDLKKQINSIENKVRYKCSFCEANFSYKVNLSIHTKKFHKKKQRSKVLGVAEKNDLGPNVVDPSKISNVKNLTEDIQEKDSKEEGQNFDNAFVDILEIKNEDLSSPNEQKTSNIDPLETKYHIQSSQKSASFNNPD